MTIFKAPAYDVIVWHRTQSSTPGLHDRIIELARRHPDDENEEQGLCDLHWGFESAEAATTFAEKFFEIAAFDDVVLLSVVASKDERFGRKVYKDTRVAVAKSS